MKSRRPQADDTSPLVKLPGVGKKTAERLLIEMRDRLKDWMQELLGLPRVHGLERVETFQKVYGKRIIIIGGGAQVGQVAIGAVSEADRHNIRGEHISVDTIPLVGESDLAEAVRAVARLRAAPPRWPTTRSGASS